jgi:penicillin-binding protein 2
VSQSRLYKHAGAAAHALGYLAEATPEQIKASSGVHQVGDWIGQKGVEGAYQRLLAGADGERRVIVDSHGREVSEANRLEATPGQNLFLTIDLKLQEIAEDYYKERVGAAVALDPRTGEILALVSSPSYDPNWFTRRVTSSEWTGLIENPDRPLQNRAVQNMYSPGSVFKVFIAYGALAQGLVDPSARIFCPGHATYYGREFRCHKRGGHGWVDLRDAIKVSCDVYFYALGRQLGIDRISEIATAFGFGQPTGIDLAFEKSGLVPSEEWARTRRGARWYPGETISVSIGQGPLLVTVMQTARALSGLLEDGRLPTPHLFYSSQDPRTGEQLRYKPEFRDGTTISPEKLAIVKDGMWAVVNEPGGTAYGSRVNGMEMGGKTGTVQVVGRETAIRAGADRARLQDHAWFAGFGPMENPEMVVVVFVEHGGHGNLAAAPLAKALFEARFGIDPSAAPPSLQASTTARPAPRTAAAVAPVSVVLEEPR